MTTASLDQAQKILRDVWGYDTFRPLQESAIRDALSARDSLTVLPTGGGKSICFQVPALCLSGMAIVVSPLISLMKDQVDALTACGVASAFLNSSQSPAEQRDIANRIERGDIKLLYLAPERLLTPRMLDFLSKHPVSFFAIDEAHCISAWGHDFRPEYRGLRVLKERFSSTPIHAFTATASANIRDDIAKQLGLQQPAIHVGNFDRPNLIYRFLRSDNRLQQVMDVIDRHRQESGIVYCISRKEVERTAQLITEMGCPALPYHAGMSDEARKTNQDDFIKERCQVIVATVAFGMGIDKSNVRFVVHAGLPKSIEHYQQESGRAGRDGLESECVLIYSGGDVVSWKRILSLSEIEDPNNGALRSLNAMFDLCSGATCRHRSIVEYFGQQYEHENCGACDICLGQQQWVDDPITLSQKILSCVVRVEERFGAAHVTKVLTGSRDKRVLELNHDQLSTHGLLADEGTSAVRTWIEQLIQQGFLLRTGEFNTLSLSPTGRLLLRRVGDPKLTLPEKSQHTPRPEIAQVSWEGVDRGLFDALRSLRSQMASEQNVPAYVIFGDATLRELARYRPTSEERLTQIKGIGEQKRDKFGGPFLKCIHEYSTEHQLSMNLTPVATPSHSPASPERPRPSTKQLPNASSLAAVQLFRQGLSVKEVAEKMGRALSTTHGYLVDFIKLEKIADPTPWVTPETQKKILSHLHLANEGRLKPIYEALGESVPYDDIRIVFACYNHANSSSK